MCEAVLERPEELVIVEDTSSLALLPEGWRASEDTRNQVARLTGELVVVQPISIVRAPHWSDRAECKEMDTEEFILPSLIESRHTEKIEAAKEICQQCPVMKDCLVSAVNQGDKYAIRGGHTPKERTSLKSRAKNHHIPVLEMLRLDSE